MCLTEGGERETVGGVQVRLIGNLPLVGTPEDPRRGEGFRSLLGRAQQKQAHVCPEAGTVLC